MNQFIPPFPNGPKDHTATLHEWLCEGESNQDQQPFVHTVHEWLCEGESNQDQQPFVHIDVENIEWRKRYRSGKVPPTPYTSTNTIFWNG